MSTRTAYQYKNTSIPKSGSSNRTICYSIPTSCRNFEFQNPSNVAKELTGHSRIHVPQRNSTESSSFSHFKVMPQPDSRRTINPYLAPKEVHRPVRCKSSNHLRYNQESSGFAYISNVPNEQNRRPTNPRIYKSFVLTDSAKPEPYHRKLKPTDFKKYDTTTQIANLPGAIKRTSNEINDNYKPSVIPNQSESHLRRVNREYNSNIACLPGSKINEEKQRNYYVCPSKIKYQSSDIFGCNENSKDNTFNVFHKKRTVNSNVNAFADSNKHFDYNAPRTGVRRSGMKNISQIQFV